MEFHLSIEGLSELISRLESAGGGIREDTVNALADSVSHIKSLVISKAPRGSSGKLAQAVESQVSYPSAKVFMNDSAPYALLVERGTGLFGSLSTVIQPVTKAVMATTTDPGWGTAPNSKGYWIIGIYQRGLEAQPFFEPSVNESIPMVTDRFQQIGSHLVVKLAGA